MSSIAKNKTKDIRCPDESHNEQLLNILFQLPMATHVPGHQDRRHVAGLVVVVVGATSHCARYHVVRDEDGMDAVTMNKVTLFHDASKGGQKRWSIWLEKDKKTVTVEWGLVGKKLQTSSDTAGTKGVEGTKSFKDEKVCAQENYLRQIKKKRDEGYREANEKADKQNWLMDLDKNFVPAKPHADTAPADLILLDQSKKLIIQRKRDGQRHLALITKAGQVKLYSRRMENMTDNFPLLCGWIACLNLPHGTILDGEIIVDRNGSDDFRAVATMTKAKPEKAAAREAELGSQVRYMVFDVLYWAGKVVWDKPYEYRYHEIILNRIPAKRAVFAAEQLDGSFKTLFAKAKKAKWEGLVCWEREEATIVRNGGTPKRVNCHKAKPVMSTDVIATGFEYGSGGMSDTVGALLLAEYDPKTGKLRDAGKCGTGFNAEMRETLRKAKYPFVIKIEADKQEASAKFRFAVFMEIHEDKLPTECVGADLGDLE